MAKRPFVARLKKKNVDPDLSVWDIVWGKKSKDLDGKKIFVDGSTEEHTVAELDGQIASMEERIDLYKDMKKEIKKEQ